MGKSVVAGGEKSGCLRWNLPTGIETPIILEARRRYELPVFQVED
jgi:hypothetical protein